ncbi:MAG: hypothetical protein ACHQ2E_03895 [Gemmatimonadales bacterium]
MAVHAAYDVVAGFTYARLIGEHHPQAASQSGGPMQRVTGLGGILFKSPDPAALGQWNRDHPGIDQTPQGRFAWVMDPDGTRLELPDPAIGQLP